MNSTKHIMSILEDVLHDMRGAKIFTKADLSSGYWHVELDEASSNLTTFQTCFGRYRWRWLPFGLNSAAEIFQSVTYWPQTRPSCQKKKCTCVNNRCIWSKISGDQRRLWLSRGWIECKIVTPDNRGKTKPWEIWDWPRCHHIHGTLHHQGVYSGRPRESPGCH